MPPTDREFDDVRRSVDRHEVELHGERGVYSALRELSGELKWLRRALWGLAAAIIVAAITIVLQGQHP